MQDEYDINEVLVQFEPLMKRISSEWSSINLPYEDIVQELRIITWKKLPQYNSLRGGLMTFLHKIYYNRLQDLKKQYRHDKTVSLDKLYNISDTQDEYLKFIVRDYIDKLSKMKYGDVTIDIYINGMREIDVAKKYNISQGYVSKVNKKNLEKLGDG